MKIGILTYWTSSDNYGQQLQCFALQTHLRNQGYDAFLIKYMPTISVPIWKRILKKMAVHRILFYFCKKKRINSEEQKLLRRNLRMNKKRNFEEFRSKFLVSTKNVYYSIDELRKNPPAADVYICGSDQVWNNPLEDNNTAGWFLDFGSSNVKRISYAASIGRELLQYELPQFSKFLANFDAISLREDSTKDICDKLGFSDSVVTMDPTFLLSIEDYLNLLENVQQTEPPAFLFLYILNVTTSDEIYWSNVFKYIQQKNLGVKIVCSSGYYQARELIPGHGNILATIPEWLWYVNNAACVMTTSFHGMVFCLKMNTPFLVILLTNRYSKGNIRIISLLEKLGLEDRIYNPAIPVKEMMEKQIDWDRVNKKLAELQELSFEFLHSNL